MQQCIQTHPHVQISQIHLLSSFEASLDFPFPPATDPFLSFTIFNTCSQLVLKSESSPRLLGLPDDFHFWG